MRTTSAAQNIPLRRTNIFKKQRRKRVRILNFSFVHLELQNVQHSQHSCSHTVIVSPTAISRTGCLLLWRDPCNHSPTSSAASHQGARGPPHFRCVWNYFRAETLTRSTWCCESPHHRSDQSLDSSAQILGFHTHAPRIWSCSRNYLTDSQVEAEAVGCAL